ncbi:hypothetical protein QR680_000300 [Steinernema hermaphroditum]|uniref:Nucleotide exchange factor Fes1 domain-containing protein n=1 Tax=Steinernema hermaphroditum TaxID=289476 RepID=A0AA39GWV2_9BILA|nr:hypothetical protein QR680_000300 [Steinernema hermaphroditum]
MGAAQCLAYPYRKIVLRSLRFKTADNADSIMAAPNQSKSDQYWRILLDMSTSVTPAAGSSMAPELAPKTLSVEDQAWIESAINELSSEKNPVSVMTSYMLDIKAKLFENKCNTIHDSAIIEEELGHINEQCYDRDIASAFCARGGINIIDEILTKTKKDGARKWAAQLLATIAQNNPEVQDQIIEKPILEQLIKFVNNESGCPLARKACVGAISAIVRNNQKCFEKFIELDGFIKLASVALKADRHNQEALLNRICVALTNIARSLEPKDIEENRINWTLAETLLAIELDTNDGIGYLVEYFGALKQEESNLSDDCWKMLRRKFEEYNFMMG